MSISGKVKNMPFENRPIVDLNGKIVHMDDERYTEYLQGLEKYSMQPAPTAEERLQMQIDDLTLAMADILGGNVK